MKIRLKELNPNPNKKEINKGKLREGIIKKIQANIKELGLMGSIPVFKKDGKYFLVAGHHRIEALKRSFGNNYEVECTLHNYSDENVLRGMIVENITQRLDEPFEVSENLNAIRNYLKNHECSAVEQSSKKLDSKGRENRQEEAGSIRNIAKWLNKNGEVMSNGKISGYLKVYDNLDGDLMKKTIVTEGAKKKDEQISIEEAKTLARLDKKQQKKMQEILSKTGLDYKKKSKLVTEYLNAPEELQEKVFAEELPMEDLPIELLKIEIKEKAEAQKEKDEGQIVVTHYKKFTREAGNKVGDTNDKILKTCAYLNGLEKSGVLYELDWNTIYRVLEVMTSGGSRYKEFGERIMNKL